MGKSHRKPRQANRNHHDFSAIKKSFSVPQSLRKGANGASSKKGKAQQQQQVKPVIPFRPKDHILLVGEGDFSFALSLVEHHKCRYVTATCYDSEDELHRKYPQTRDILERLLSYNDKPGSRTKQHLPLTSGDRVRNHNNDDSQSQSQENNTNPPERRRRSSPSSPEWEGFSPSSTSTPPSNIPPLPNPPSTPALINGSTKNNPNRNTITFHPSISATHLPASRPLRHHSPYNKIIFNFPHVGGLSTDVNRQVRANQELLVSFFRACKPLLASASNPTRPPKSSDLDSNSEDEDDGEEEKRDKETRTKGQVITTLFSSSPYTLWNIKDLARHCGYRVVSSWRFPWEVYPGYRHARTLGNIVSKGENEEERRGEKSKREEGDGNGKERKGAWRGEEREARGYVFELVDDDDDDGHKVVQQRKRRRRSSSGSSSDSDD